MIRSKRGTAAIAFLLTAAMAPANAQTSTSRAVNPDRQDQATQGRIANAPVLKTPAPAASGGIKVAPFVLRAVVVEKSTLPQAQIDQATRAFIGQTVTADTLGKIADSVASLYEATDIALYTVTVPNQDFADGRLRLVAAEGHIGRITAKGDTSRDLSQAKAYADRLTADVPLHRPVLERYVSLMRDIPGFNPGLSLEQGPSIDDVSLAVEAPPQDFRIAAAVNNRGTALLGRTQVEVDGYYYGLFKQGDETRATIALPTDIDRFQYYALAHSTILDDEGTTLSGNIGYLRTRPDFASLTGDAESLGFQLSHPFIRDFTHALYGTLGIDGLNANNALFGETIGSDRVRAARASAAYVWQAPEEFFRFNATLSQGIDGIGARTLFPDTTDLNFTKITGKAIYNTLVLPHWILRLEAAGQYTGSLLPASEQFALGGDELGRAYEASFIAGDSGLAGLAELAWQLDDYLPERLAASEVYAFTDGGRVRFNGRLGLPGTNYDLASVGGGSRLMLDKRWQLQVEATRGLENPIPGLNREIWRAIFAVRTFF